jgi:hypothetical protein
MHGWQKKKRTKKRKISCPCPMSCPPYNPPTGHGQGTGTWDKNFIYGHGQQPAIFDGSGQGLSGLLGGVQTR